MKREKKLKKQRRFDALPIRYKIFGYLGLFVFIMLSLLWIFQIGGLDYFYQAIKTKTLRGYADAIESNINDPALEELIESISADDLLCVLVLDENGNRIYSHDGSPLCSIHRMSDSGLKRITDYIDEHGSYSYTKRDDVRGREASKSEETEAQEIPAAPKVEPSEPSQPSDKRFTGFTPIRPYVNQRSMIYAQDAVMTGGQKMYIILNAQITPVNATVQTLRVQLLFISVILVAFAAALSIWVSRTISRPIINTCADAKKLADGDYSGAFDETGYREIKELNDTLKYAAGELGKLGKLQEELISNISHDLRTPLTMITGYSEVMRDIPGENTAENVQVIIDESRRLSSLVTSLLDYSQLRSGLKPLSKETFNLTGVISDVIERFSKMLPDEDLTLEFNPERDVYVYGDEMQLTRVVYNLISNAITYSGKHKVVRVLQEENAGAVRISVCDNGAGIKPEDMKYIWDRYYCGDKTHSRPTVGSGLGLSIVKTVLTMHDSVFGAESEAGKGATFYFTLNTVEVETAKD
ncbi:MAG: HAMP domain-containing sensor histidine kinase [Eubacteriales bacterium]|nr:HAMP domain-containing sensor histidine kinase [Eubacteriales bacterium]MDD3882549.1 HAMP domain-containing sensor histidine kinase [Eubacteriales bacterium]MDD4512849.1 HAMP domain-containing sensor histidine kinase [Eubacteriales bacterium]